MSAPLKLLRGAFSRSNVIPMTATRKFGNNSAAESQDRMKALLLGVPGTGKSRTAATIAVDNKTFWVDMPGENGLQSAAGSPWFKNIYVEKPQTIDELDEMYDFLAFDDHDFGAVVLDSLSAVHYMVSRTIRGRKGNKIKGLDTEVPDTLKIQWYMNIAQYESDLATYWFNLADGTRERPMHVVMTCLPVVKEDEVLGVTTVTPDVQRKALSQVLGAPDFNMWCAIEENESTEQLEHCLYFGGNPYRSQKSRIPVNKDNALPHRLSSKNMNLTLIGRKLELPGFPAPIKKEAK